MKNRAPELTPKQKRETLDAQRDEHGIARCAYPGCEEVATEVNHKIPSAMHKWTRIKVNDPENREGLCAPHHALHTKLWVKIMAKCDRLAETHQGEKRRGRVPMPWERQRDEKRSRFPKGRKIQSANNLSKKERT